MGPEYNQWKPGCMGVAVGAAAVVGANVVAREVCGMIAETALKTGDSILDLDPSTWGTPIINDLLTKSAQADSLGSFFNPSLWMQHPWIPVVQIAGMGYVSLAESLPTRDKLESKFTRLIREANFHLSLISISLAVPILSEIIKQANESLVAGVPINVTGLEGFILLYAAGSLLRARSRFKRSEKYQAECREEAQIDQHQQRVGQAEKRRERERLAKEREYEEAHRPKRYDNSSEGHAQWIADFIEGERADLEAQGYSPAVSLKAVLEGAIKSLHIATSGGTPWGNQSYKQAYRVVEHYEEYYRQLDLEEEQKEMRGWFRKKCEAYVRDQEEPIEAEVRFID